ncbi:DUF3343 domain-containing protein [candidate division WOR-3 bacterium]|nr:DUF3343 domain-containing protein [candidate division WOR-3 bacterium]
MPEKEVFGIVLFHSVSSAFRLERHLKSKNIPLKLMPVPRHLDSDCGTSLRFFWKDSDAVREGIKIVGIEVKEILKL